MWQLDVIQLNIGGPVVDQVNSSRDIFAVAKSGGPQQLRDSLQAGANIASQDSYGQTPLIYAATENPDPAVAAEMVRAGADVNATTEAGWTALMYAARDNDNPEVLLTLLQSGADPTMRSNEGLTAYDYAADNGALRRSRLYPMLRELSTRPFDRSWPSGYLVPLEGATFSSRASHLAGARRAYRNGWHEGFDFFEGVSSIPITFGMPALAVADGTVVRAQHDYAEMTVEEIEALLDDAANRSVTPPDTLDQLRGQQVWIEHVGGYVSRYVHLAGIPDTIQVGARVSAGQVVGSVGNSGTIEAARGTQDLPHLHYELWRDDTYLGEGQNPTQIYQRIGQIFGQASLPPYTGE